MEKIQKWVGRRREVLAYLFFGVLTTVVNYIVYGLATRVFAINYLASNALAWLFAVLFAYFTNRRWVFQSRATGLDAQGLEFLRFVGGRIASLGIDMGIMFLGITVLHLATYDFWVKTVAQIFVVVSNYAISKYFVFREK